MQEDKEEAMKVFLDTSVLLEYFRGKPQLKDLFSPEVMKKVRYAINPIVMQELFLLSSASESKVNVEEFTRHLEILPVEIIKSEESLKRVRALRNRLAHANDFLILGSAQSCDYLLTYDRDLQQLGTVTAVKALAPEEFLKLIEEQS